MGAGPVYHHFWHSTLGHIVRLLAIGLIVALLVPRLFSAFVDLYTILLQHDKVPRGNPMKVEAPLNTQKTVQ